MGTPPSELTSAAPAEANAQATDSRLDRWALPVALGLLALNLALKFRGLEAQGLWFDEAMSIRNAMSPLDLAQRLRADASPPLFGLLLTGWGHLFGWSLPAARSLSAVLSSLTAVLLFLLGRRLSGAAAGLVGALLFSLSRVQAFFAHEVRPYALVGLLCAASFLTFVALFDASRRRSGKPDRHELALGLGLALANAALLYAHYLAALALLAQALAAIGVARRAARSFRFYLASQALAGALVAPYALWVALHWPPPMSGWAVAPDPDRLLYVLTILAGSRVLLVLEIAIVAAAVLARRGRGSPAARSNAASRPGSAPGCGLLEPGVVLSLWFLVPIAIGYLVSQLVPIFLHRYLLYASLGLVLLVGRAVVRLPTSSAVRTLVAGGVLALSAGAMVGHPLLRPSWREAAEIVQASRGEGTLAIVSPPFQLLPFSFHFDRVAFDDPENLVGRLAAQGVVALPLPDVIAAARELPADRLVLALSEEFGPVPRELTQRMASAGFGQVEERRLDRVVVLTFARGE